MLKLRLCTCWKVLSQVSRLSGLWDHAQSIWGRHLSSLQGAGAADFQSPNAPKSDKTCTIKLYWLHVHNRFKIPRHAWRIPRHLILAFHFTQRENLGSMWKSYLACKPSAHHSSFFERPQERSALGRQTGHASAGLMWTPVPIQTRNGNGNKTVFSFFGSMTDDQRLRSAILALPDWSKILSYSLAGTEAGICMSMHQLLLTWAEHVTESGMSVCRIEVPHISRILPILLP